MSDTTDRDDLVEHAEEIRRHFEDSIQFQNELKVKTEEEGRLHDECNEVSEEQLEASKRLFARVDAQAKELSEMDDIIKELEARFARENRQYEALVEVLEAREAAAQKALSRIEAEDKATVALEAELRDLKAKLESLKG